MSAKIPLERLETVIDAAGVSASIELLLPVGVRPRQLSVRTLLLGMLLVAGEQRPCHLTRVHETLSGLSEAEQWRLGVLASRKTGRHELSYRQVEYTFTLVASALAKDKPDGSPSQTLSETLDALLQASVKVCGEPPSSSLAIDWTDLQAWASPPHRDGRCADPEAAWGHRTANSPAEKETFYGYYLQAMTIVREEHGPEVPELIRRIQLASPKHDPPAMAVPVIERMTNSGIAISDALCDSGYSYREPETFALPMRSLGAKLVMDLHPNDRGMKGTHHGAIIANGNLYCPATPKALFELSPLPPAATTEQTAEHDGRCAELARHKLSPLTAEDKDGYHRVACPAIAGKVRCPLRAASLTLGHERPTIPSPPEHPPTCCQQKTITVPASVNAKTTQKHDYPSPQHRRSYARRSGAERANATIKDPATNNLTRGWCRLTGLTPIALFTATVLITRNLRIANAFTTRQAEATRRQARGLPPRTRRRRRHQTIHDLTAPANAPPT